MAGTPQKAMFGNYLRYGVGFAIAFIFLGVALWSYPRAVSNFVALQRASEDHLQLRMAFSLIQDMETGQRGYLLTGKENYLEPFEKARSIIKSEFDNLAARLDSPRQLARLTNIRDLYERKLALMLATITARRSEGIEAAQEIMISDEGKRLMDQIRVIVDDAEQDDRVEIQRLAEIGERYSSIMFGAMASAMSTLILTGILIFLMLRKHVAERQALLLASEQSVESLEHVNVALGRANEELQHFAYVASHDLQEPLRSISGYVQLLGRRYAGELDEKALGYIAKTQAAALRMQNLIEDLLSYTRVSTQARPFDEVSTGRIVAEVVSNLAASIDEAHATIHYQHLPAVWGDRVQITQLFQNLISNAVKFRGQKAVEIWVEAVPETSPPQVTPAAAPRSRRWRFSVRDNGIGIAPEFQGRLFKIFQRLHTRNEYPGTGIGLAICKRIVERHGGQIWLESEFGHGTTFHFSLPNPAERNQ